MTRRMNRLTAGVCLVVLCCLSSVSLGKKPGMGIVGGANTDISAVPYQVSITTYGFHYCGGTIINSRTIVTAAHCVRKRNVTDIEVHVGSSHRWKDGVTYKVLRAIPHPDFKLRNLANDVGILITSEPIKFGKEVKPASLPAQDEPYPVGKKATVSGWGLKHVGADITEILQSAVVPILDHDTCQKTHKKKIYDTMFCAGNLEGGVDACQQDSGGPLVLNNKLVGVVSWGDGCGEPNSPGVYVHVAKLRKWIDDNMMDA